MARGCGSVAGHLYSMHKSLALHSQGRRKEEEKDDSNNSGSEPAVVVYAQNLSL